MLSSPMHCSSKSVTKLKLITLMAATLLLVTGSFFGVRGQDVQMQIPPGDYAHQIGNGSLADPSGAAHTRRDAANQVIVAIFSIPNMSQGSYQEKWADLLAHQPETKLPNSVFLVLFENMAQAGMFKGIARSDMKEQFTKGSRPLVVLDETGAIFKKYGVPPDKTEILIYDKKGTLRDVEQNLADQDATMHRIQLITKKLRDTP
jgi:hypothetical protein